MYKNNKKLGGKMFLLTFLFLFIFCLSFISSSIGVGGKIGINLIPEPPEFNNNTQSANTTITNSWTRDIANAFVKLTNIADFVGIGTTTPSHELNVVGESNFTGDLMVKDDLFFVNTGTNRVGIGTNTPDTKFELNQGNLRIDPGWQLQFGGDGTLISGNKFQMNFNVNGLRVIHVLWNSGNVGIGTATPSHKLNVVGTGNFTANLTVADRITVKDLNVTGTSYLGDVTLTSDNITVNNIISKDGNISFWNSTGENVRITEDGSVGIGTSTPSHELNVVGDVNISNGDLLINKDSKKIFFGSGQDASIKYDGSDLVFNPQEVGSGDNLFSSGAIVLGTNGQIFTNTNGMILQALNNQKAINFQTKDNLGEPYNRLTLSDTNSIFNEQSLDVDLRVESDNNANMLFVDAGNDRVLIGADSTDVATGHQLLSVKGTPTRPITSGSASISARMKEDTTNIDAYGGLYFAERSNNLGPATPITKNTYGIRGDTMTEENTQVNGIMAGVMGVANNYNGGSNVADMRGGLFKVISESVNGKTNITNAYGVYSDLAFVNSGYSAFVTNAYDFYGKSILTFGSVALTNATGIWLEKQTAGTNNYGIVLDGDGAGADIVFGAGQDASIYWDGTNLIFDTNITIPDTESQGNAWFSRNVSATGYITRTSVYDKSRGNALQYIKDSNDYRIGLSPTGKIDHSAFYGYTTYPVTDYSKPVNVTKFFNRTIKIYENYIDKDCSYELRNDGYYDYVCNDVIKKRQAEDCKNVTKYRYNKINGYYSRIEYKEEVCNPAIEEKTFNRTITTYPYTKTEEGVNLGMEVDVLRQAVYELNEENTNIKNCVNSSKDFIEMKSCIGGL